MRGHGAARSVLLLGTAAVWLVLTAIVGAIAVSDDHGGAADTVAAGSGQTDFGTGGTTGEAGTADTGDEGVDFAAGTDTTAVEGAEGTDPAAAPQGGGQQPGAAPQGGQPQGGNPPQSASGGDSTGVTPTEIKIGIHAPETFSGVPLKVSPRTP